MRTFARKSPGFSRKLGVFLVEDGDFCIDLEKEDDEIEDFGVIMR